VNADSVLFPGIEEAGFDLYRALTARARCGCNQGRMFDFLITDSHFVVSSRMNLA